MPLSVYMPKKKYLIQWKILTFSILITIIIALLYVVLTTVILKSDKFYTYHGANGPYKAVPIVDNPNAAEDFKLGDPASFFKPNDWVGYCNYITIYNNITVNVILNLYNKDSKKILSSLEYTVTGNQRVDEPHSIFFHLPVDIPAGSYELNRKLIFYPNFGVPVSQTFNSIPFEVVK